MHGALKTSSLALGAIAALLALTACQGNGVALLAATDGPGETGSASPAVVANPNASPVANSNDVAPLTSTPSPASPNTATSSNANANGNGNATTSKFYVMSPYKDISLSFDGASESIGTAVSGTAGSVLTAVPNLPALTWAFATGECGQEKWPGVDAGALASANVAAFHAAGMGYIISTGGAGASFTCGSDAGFATFLARYRSKSLLGIDYDIENNQTNAQVADLVARTKTAEQDPNNAALRFSFTIATEAGTDGTGLGQQGDLVMKAIAAGGLPRYLINLMVMDYGNPSTSACVLAASGQCDMGASAIQAAKTLHARYNVPYAQIELTPMIGTNDDGAVFAAADVKTMMEFVRAQGLAGVHYWSLDRDRDCVQSGATDVCNSIGGVGTLGFLRAFLAQ